MKRGHTQGYDPQFGELSQEAKRIEDKAIKQVLEQERVNLNDWRGLAR